MSEERKKRKAQREREQSSRKGPLPKAAIAVLILAAFALAIYLGFRQRHKSYDDFARCISAKGARMYGAFWCPHCEEQKELFGSSFQYVNYVECGVKGDVRAQTQVCKDAGIKHYPTWEFADKSRVEGKKSFQYLSEQTTCKAP
jgi:hypothetical protein